VALVRALEKAAVEELIVRPLQSIEVTLDSPKAINERIYEVSNGHPCIVQRIGRRLLARMYRNESDTGALWRRITLDDLEAVVADPGFQREDFLNVWWQRLTRLDVVVSLLMARDPGLQSLEAVHHAVKQACDGHVAAADTHEALQSLVLRSILREGGGGYEFAVGSYPEIATGIAAGDALYLNVQACKAGNQHDYV
jgi:hypothetical protein